MFMKRILVFVLGAGLAAQAAAQAFPSRTVRIVVPYSAGGGVDVLARALGVELSTRWGQPVVIENIVGAGGNIGADAAAKATADGHTLLATTSQTFTTNRYLYKSLPFDPDRAFVPVTLLVQSDQFVLAHAAVPAADLKQLVAYERQNSGKLNYGSWGKGSEPQMTYEYLNKREGLALVHVPYKGVAPVLTAITAGEVQLTMGSAGVAGRLIQAGRVKALAVAAPRRSTRFPDVPTTAELGYPYLRAAILIGLWAPANTPKSALDRIGADVRGLVKTPAFADKQISARGFDPVGNSPEEFAKILREETAHVAEVVKAANIQPE